MIVRTLLTALLLAAAPPPAPLTLEFAGLREPSGAVMIAIFKDEASWNGGAPVRVAMVAVTGGTARLIVEGLEPGRYAVKVFHDVDGDGRMGMNPFGIPLEPYGFSRDAMGERGAPAWGDAAFELGADGAIQTITLR